MSEYHDIITAAFPPEKARRILQREQKQRGIVTSTVQRPAPPFTVPTQRIKPVIVQPSPAPPVVVYHTQTPTQANTSQHTGTVGRVALLFVLSWFGV